MAQITVTDSTVAQDMTDAQANFTELYEAQAATDAEIEAARDGEATLLAKEQAQDSSIAALALGSGAVVSATDETVGYLNGKLVAGDNVSFVQGGTVDQTLTISSDVYGGASVASSAIDLTLISSSKRFQKITITAKEKFVIFPDATGLEEGIFSFIIENSGNFRFGIKDASGAFLGSVDVGETGYFHLIDNSDSAGTWSLDGGTELIMSRLKTVCNADASTFLSSCKLTDTEVFVAYQGTDQDGFCCVLTWVPGTPEITVSNILEFDTDIADYISCCRVSDTVACISYQGTSSYGYTSAITYDGVDTLTITDKYTLTAGVVITYSACVTIDSSKIFVAYTYGVTTMAGQVLDWDGATLSSDTAQTTIYAFNAMFIDVALLEGSASSASIIISCGDAEADLTTVHVAWNGTTLVPTVKEINTQNIYVSSVVSLSSNYFVVTAMHAAFEIKSYLFYVSGSTVSLLRTLRLGSYVYAGYGMRQSSTSLIDSEHVGVTFTTHDKGTTYLYKLKAVGAPDVQDSVFKVESVIELPGYGADYPMLTVLDENSALRIYDDDDNSSYLTAEKVDIA